MRSQGEAATAAATLLALGVASFVLGAAWTGLETYNMLDLHKRAVAAE